MSKIVQIEIQINLQWRAVPGVKKGVWVGVCDALDLSIEADSLDELHSIIPESMHTLLVDLVQDNEFEAYLRERGWVSSAQPAGRNLEDMEFRVPWQLIVPGII